MRSDCGIRFACLLCLPLAFASLGVLVAQTAEYNFDVTSVLYRSSDEAERAVPSAHLTFPTITVAPGVTSVQDLLSSLHFYVNSDVLGLMYDLNPDLGDTQAVKPGIRIRVLQIVSLPESARAFSEGFQWKISYDKQLISSILTMRGNIRKLGVSSASNLSFNVPAEAASRQKALTCVSDASRNFDRIEDHLEDRDQPMNHEMLSQVRADAELLSQILARMSGSPQGAAGEEDVIRVCTISKDLAIKLTGFQGARGESTLPPWPQARVLTNTIDSATGKLVQMWQVHYVGQALQNVPLQEHQLPVFSSPAELKLPEADYVFWATKTGNGSASSDRLTVSVRVSESSKPMQVDIPVHEKP